MPSLCPLCPFREVTPPASLRNDKDVVYLQGNSLLYPLTPVVSCGAHWLNPSRHFLNLVKLPNIPSCPSCTLLTCHIVQWTLSPLDHGPMRQRIRNPTPAIGHTNMACLLGPGEFFFFLELTKSEAEQSSQTSIRLVRASLNT